MTAKAFAHGWIDENRPRWSEWNRTIWEFGETAWREYRSAEWYAQQLETEGFEVERGSGSMPTAFSARRTRGNGPTIASYAEYDGVPDNCQAADTVERPRDGFSKRAGGHTDPHSALGIATFVGVLAAARAMERYDIAGTLAYFGEPAEKTRGSKPIHAAKGYYDHLDAAISFHPFYMLPLCNTARWDTHCGAGYSWVYRFICDRPETWPGAGSDSPIPASHAAPRAPGAGDAVAQMYLQGKVVRDHIVASGVSWSLNETILTSGQATADNLPSPEGEILYMARMPTVEMAHHLVASLDRIADAVAAMTHCRWERQWVAKSREGLANHAMAALAYENLVAAGPPVFGAEAVARANEMREALGRASIEAPFLPETERLVPPQEAEAALRRMLPETQRHFTSDDYTEYCWHCPTARFYVGRPALAPKPGEGPNPAWVMNALGGISACIDPMIASAAKTVAGTILDLFGKPEVLAEATAEFNARTGGGIGGTRWLAPQCDYAPPIDLGWPEYVTTPRGMDWSIPLR
ncbi:zinc-binding metallopeptidase family protein [Pararhizobium mangrovi]|uniref:Amidohydrolase n=1 Tax=Pararhizobium mangrovi TaxID=2590452 RepID=A0A506UG59_9HYPH|nr:amidohydrolase [Pararhizobium mangrovi]TPW31979.1 amidohydrolase [Pararhizobium mangrovi]